MKEKLLSFLLGISKSLAASLIPLIAGELAKLFTVATEKARVFVVEAAQKGELPNGEARHNWATEQVFPLVRQTGADLIPAVRNAVVNLAVKSAYDQMPK